MNRKFGTPIATLIAALSIAVAIDVAPANAAVGSMSASLSISPAGGGLQEVVVSGVVRTSSESEALYLYNLGYRAVYTLWGDDPIWDNRLWGPLYIYLQSEYYAQPDGLHFSTAIVVGSRYLNEDWGGDEVYAGVRLVDFSHGVNLSGPTIRSAQSNTVYGNF